MKKIFLTLTITLGALAFAAEIGSQRAGTQIVTTTLDAPPPDCWPDCAVKQ
jgi:hypothetical protein